MARVVQTMMQRSHKPVANIAKLGTGRKKYGNKKFQALSQKGRKR